jgi:hypothetical protein
MKDTILKLKTILLAKDFVVTGSFVLSEYGLVPKTSVMDVDIVLIQPEQSTIDTLNRLMAEYPSKVKLPSIGQIPEAATGKKSTTKPPLEISASFIFDKVVVDIFIKDTLTYPTINVDGLKYTTIPPILEAKKRYNRMKDWLQCRDMARLIFVPEAFEAMLNTTWRSTLKTEY